MNLLKNLALLLMSMAVSTLTCTVFAVTTDGWYWHSPTYTSLGIEAVLRTPNGIIACGENGSTWMMDTNGQWTYNTTGSSDRFDSIIYSNNRYYVTTYNEDFQKGGIMSSTDGTNWQLEYEQDDVYIYDIIANGNSLLAFGTKNIYVDGSTLNMTGVVLSSKHNGVWQLIKEFPDQGIDKAIYAKGRYLVALKPYVTTDTKTFTILTSSNGTDWNGPNVEIENNSSYPNDYYSKVILGVANNEVYAVFTNYTKAGRALFSKSADGLNWTEPVEFSVPCEWLVHHNGVWVAIDSLGNGLESGRIYTSVDLTQWSLLNDPEWAGFGPITRGVFSDQEGILIPSHGQILSSNDGQTWVPLLPKANNFNHADSLIESNYIISVGAIAGQFDLFPRYESREPINGIYSGPNFHEMEVTYSAVVESSRGLTSIAKGKNNYVAVGAGIALTSTDGINWVETTTGLRPQTSSTEWINLDNVVYAPENEAYYAVGNTFGGIGRGSAIYASFDDGASWEHVTGISYIELREAPLSSIAYGWDDRFHGARVAAVGASNSEINFWRAFDSRTNESSNIKINLPLYYNDQKIYNRGIKIEYFPPLGYVLIGYFQYGTSALNSEYVTYILTTSDPELKHWNFMLWENTYYNNSTILGDALVVNIKNTDEKSNYFYYTKDGVTWYKTSHNMPDHTSLQGLRHDTMYATGQFNSLIETGTSLFDYNTVIEPDNSILSDWSHGFLGPFVAYPEKITINMWIWHPNHGFVYLVRTDFSSAAYWIYDPTAYETIGWVYSTKDFYPFFFSTGLEDWLYYWEGSSSPRLFYSYKSNSWLEL